VSEPRAVAIGSSHALDWWCYFYLEDIRRSCRYGSRFWHGGRWTKGWTL